jgi:hypothetical protein
MKRPGSAGRVVRPGAVLRTGCGRELVVSRLRLDGLPHPVRRVVLGIGCQPYDQDEVWVSMTAAEARQLAGQLMVQAAVLEDGSGAR